MVVTTVHFFLRPSMTGGNVIKDSGLEMSNKTWEEKYPWAELHLTNFLILQNG